jgi:hypothetical protein
VVIEGYTHRDGTPFLDILLEIPALGIKRKISFLIDTGSPVTILSERDARKLKLEYKNLSSANGNIMGLGGFSETYVLKKPTLHFLGREGMLKVRLNDLYVSRNIVADREVINQIPSLLGRDVLKDFTLTFNEKRKIVSLKQ